MRTGHQTLTLIIEGVDVQKMEQEAGAHRLQRIPPTERAGRVHSSTITVSVLGMESPAREALKPYQQRLESDYKLEWFNGTTKAGGQHHQKNATCCRMTHIPTGIIKTAQTRSRVNSQVQAVAALNQELNSLAKNTHGQAVNQFRRNQIGNGGRAGVKRRTWRFQEDVVIDHLTGRKARAEEVMAGRFNLLWE